MMLTLLREKMNDITAREIAIRAREPTVKYDEVYSDICRRFGGEAGSFRQRWKSAKLSKDRQGNVTAAEWRRFRVEILAAVAQHPGEEEVAIREHILSQLPEAWRLAVVKRELRNKNQAKSVRVWLMEGRTTEKMVQGMQPDFDFELRPHDLEGQVSGSIAPTRMNNVA